MGVKTDIEFDRFWNRCIDRIEYMEKHTDGEITLASNMIAVAYELAKLLKQGNHN